MPEQAIPEISVIGKRIDRKRFEGGGGGLVGFGLVSAGTVGAMMPRQFQREVADLLKPAAKKIAQKAPAVIEEIKVIAKKPILRAGIGAAGSGIVGLATVGAMISESISRERLEEAKRVFDAVEPRPKDSPVKKIPKEVIPEIVVTAKRPFPGRQIPLAFVPDFGLIADRFLLDTFPKEPVGRPTAAPTPKVKAPTAPKKRPRGIGDLTRLSPGILQFPETAPETRSFRLGIGRPGPGLRDPITPTLTDFDPRVVAFPQPSRRAQFCPPCKPKKKNRKTCWKKMVVELRTRDKVSKWNRVDCKTGKEISTQRKK